MATSGTAGSSSNNSRQREITNIKAPLWDHVEILERPGIGGGNAKWKCKFCGYVGLSSYSRVKNHLLKVTNGGIATCKKVTVDILFQLKNEVARAAAEVDKSKPRNVTLPSKGSSGTASVASHSLDSAMFGNKKRRGPEGALERAWANDLRNQQDAIIARMFYSGGLSINLSRNPYYQQSYAFASNHNMTGYVPPGYNKLRTTLLQQERAHIENLLEHKKSVWPEKGVTICSDGWSDAQRRPLINFIAVCEDAPMFLKAVNAEGEVKTKEYIAEKMIAIIEEVGPKHVVQIITDNASNCKGAGLIVQQKYNHIFWTPCVVHTLNLALKSICHVRTPREDDEEAVLVFNELKFINDVREDATFIKNFIMNHGMRLSMFNEFSKLKLLAVAETRFASVVIMLKRFCTVKRALQTMVISDQWDSYRDGFEGVAATVRDKILSAVWWDDVEYIVKFTEPIYEMLCLADTDTPCLHLIYEMWDSMIENVSKVICRHEGKEIEQANESTFWKVIEKILIERWYKGNTPLHSLAHSLNPRYYSQNWLNEDVARVAPHKDVDVSRERMKCFKKIFPTQEDFTRVKEEYSRFSTSSKEFNECDSIYDRWTLSPHDWWANHGQSIPLLQNLALKLIQQPASSSCCERNWSTYNFIHSVKRNALTPERAEDLVFVHNNLRLLSRRSEAYKTGPSKMWDVGGDAFESLDGVGILEVASLSLEEPELESVSFGDVEVPIGVEEEQDGADEE